MGNQFARGQFTFQPNATQNPATKSGGDTFADFLLGDLYQSEAAVSIASAKFRRNGWSFYIDDTWKVTPKLTLALGLRYEITPPFYDTSRNVFSVYIPYEDRTPNVADTSPLSAVHPRADRAAATRMPESTSAGRKSRRPVRRHVWATRLVQTDNNDFAPRIGITYSPDSKWVIRTGAGMFYNQDTGNPRFDLARNIAGRIRVNSDLQNPTLFWSNALSNISGGVANITLPYAFANKYERRTPYSMEYLFNIQRQLGGDLVLEVGYLGSISRKLEFLRAVNESLPGTVGSAQTRAPYPNFGRIQLVDNSANGAYNSLAVKLTKRFSQGFTFLSSYTWSKSHGRFERHPRAGTGHAVPAEQLLPQVRVGALGLRHPPPVRDLDASTICPIGKGRRSASTTRSPTRSSAAGRSAASGPCRAASRSLRTSAAPTAPATAPATTARTPPASRRTSTIPSPSRWWDPCRVHPQRSRHLRQRRPERSDRSAILHDRRLGPQGIPHAV